MDFLKSPSPILKKKENIVKCFETQMKLPRLCFGQKDIRFCKLNENLSLFLAVLSYLDLQSMEDQLVPPAPPPPHTCTHTDTQSNHAKEMQMYILLKTTQKYAHSSSSQTTRVPFLVCLLLLLFFCNRTIYRGERKIQLDIEVPG